MLRLFNTMTRAKDEFRAIDDMKVGLYTCGPTVYNYAHIGNLRTYIFEDVLKRTLAASGFTVKHVMNVTDVGHLTSDADQGDDKMELGAAREGKTVWEIANYYWEAFKADMARLNLLPPDIWCKATDYIPDQIELIQRLEERGFTYILADGVYFDTGKLHDYGKLARLDVEGLQAGARVDVVEGKRNLTDFALWKFSPTDKKRLMEWPSPWGVGFPGWHAECSAMALKHLGERLDIHCGGVDHIAVHHTNEIAQTESVTGKRWVNWWMHGEFLTMAKSGGDDAKMSKSTGGFLRVATLMDKGYDPLAYRYFCLNAHYRVQMAFSWESMDAAVTAFERLRAKAIELRSAAPEPVDPADEDAVDRAIQYADEFLAAAQDDLNMPQALAAMWTMLRDPAVTKAEAYVTLLEMDKILGFGLDTIQPRKVEISDELTQQVQKLIDDRNAARKAKDFALADEIKKQILALGVTIKDTPKGTEWTKN